ncbi:MAG: Coq4 family protein [Myxococcota bacterium]
METKRPLPVPEMLLALLSPIRPVEAARAFRTLLDDPNDTGQVFRMVRALSGPQPAWLLWRFRHHPDGARLLRDRPALLPRLLDREALRRLPEGTLGRAYAAFCEAEGITADGLIAASEAAPIPLDPATSDLAFMHHRLRDSHDLWHVVTGYRGDLIGEPALLGFTFAQTRHPGLALIAAGAWHRLAEFPDRRQIPHGFARGRRAAWLPPVPWEDLLDRPLEEVRRTLRIDPPPTYTDVRML